MGYLLCPHQVASWIKDIMFSRPNINGFLINLAIWQWTWGYMWKILESANFITSQIQTGLNVHNWEFYELNRENIPVKVTNSWFLWWTWFENRWGILFWRLKNIAALQRHIDSQVLLDLPPLFVSHPCPRQIDFKLKYSWTYLLCLYLSHIK